MAFALTMLEWPRRQKSFVVLGMDVILCIVAILVSFSLRVGALSFPISGPLIFGAVAVPLFIPIFVLSGAYSTIFRFTGARTISHLAKASLIYSVFLTVAFFVSRVEDVPRTVALLHPIIFFGCAAAARIFIRYILTDFVLPEKFGGRSSRVMIYGAGMAGQQLALSLRHEPGVLVTGFIDDDARLNRQRLNGLQVFHSSDLAQIVKKRRVDKVLLALPNASRQRRRQIVEDLRPLNLHVQTLPGVSELVGGKVSVNDLREIQIEDLLGRDTVPPNEILLGRTIVGRTVLVTGAGGSIGSELCRQILRIGARRIVLFDLSEYALYSIEAELCALAREAGDADVEIVPVLGSTADRQSVQSVFSKWRPETIYHAAAYKHVPLVEANPLEGIRNNILGTYEVLRAARSGASDFILVSTDKAVRPTNVMGASKRAAEQLVQSAAAARDRRGRLSIVRFGNVLGSSGSVVPLFRQQIEKGGPITLTHKDVTRYFMTIPEAALLVIQAGGMAKGGEVFVLDMGKPVRIYDLARSMVHLSGLKVRLGQEDEGDIEIREVGLRAGEKLYEELLIGDNPQPTDHPRIMKAHEEYLPQEELDTFVARIQRCQEVEESLEILKEMVPEFDHNRDCGLAKTA